MDRASTYIPIAQTNFTDYILEPIESTENASNKKRFLNISNYILNIWDYTDCTRINMAAKTSLNKVVYLTKIDEKIISRNTLRKIELFPLNSESWNSKLKLF